MKNAKKEKHHWVPLEQRYAPLFRDGQSVLYRNGDHPSRFDGHFIPANAFFGQLSDGRRFIVVVEGSKVGMVSHTGLSMWDSTFYQSILDFLKKAGIKFTQFGAISNIHHADFTPAIHNSQDLILSNLYSAHTVFHPFTDYILFIADQQDPLTECTKKSFKNFQVSASSMKILKDISLSLFHLEREYMDSYFLENKNTERRLKALNRWYAFLGYKIRFDTEPFQVPIFNATLNDLYLVDTAYLKSAQYPLSSNPRPEKIFYCELLLETAHQLKREPLVGRDFSLHQTAVKFYSEKKNPKPVRMIKQDSPKDTSPEAAPNDKTYRTLISKTKELSAVPSEFQYEKHTLYVYQGTIKCTRNHHRTVCVTANIPTASNIIAVLNVNLCLECHRFFISYDEYARYLERYKSLLTRIVLVNGNGSELFSGNFAEASPLKLCGYSVSQSKGFSQQERENLLAEVIHNGIMSKPDVIQYLNWFIKMNGHKTGNSIAKKKWESDLAFVRSLDIKKQTTYTISNVVPYKQRRSKK